MPSLANTLRRCHSTVPGGQEQLGADLRVGPSVHREPGDGRFLRGEAGARLDRVPADRLAGRRQLAPGAFGERLGADRGEHLVGGPQLLASVGAPVLAAQPLAVEQVRAGQFGPERSTAEPVDRLAVEALGGPALAQQRARARLDPQPELGPAGLGDARQPGQRIGGQLRCSRCARPLRSARAAPTWTCRARACPRWPAGPRPGRRRSGRGRWRAWRPPSARRSPRCPVPRRRPRRWWPRSAGRLRPGGPAQGREHHAR